MNARRGSAAFANDWQWLVGFPVLAFLLWFFRAYLNRGIQEMLSGQTAIGAVVAAAIAFVITLFAGFFIRLLIAPSTLFYQEKDRADELAARLVPRILVSLVPAPGHVRVVGTRVRQGGQPGATGPHGATGMPAQVAEQRGPDSKWVQIIVQSATDVPLVDCEVHLIKVERLNNDKLEAILTEATFCTWSRMIGDEQKRMTIRPKIPQTANIFSVEQGNPRIYTHTTHLHYDFDDEIQKAGRYKLSIGVSAQNCNRTELLSLILNWGGSYDAISVDLA